MEPVVKNLMSQLVPLQSMEVNDESDINLQTIEDSAPEHLDVQRVL